jgi:predicted esterase
LEPGIHQTTVAGLSAIVVVGNGYSPGAPTYLGFHLHGDGGDYDKFKSANNPVTRFIRQRGWVFVSLLSPNGWSWWQQQAGDHDQRLADAFEEMFARYNLCRGIVLGSSGSGGSEYWTSYFFPAKGDLYPAHVVVSCGGNSGHTSEARARIRELGQNAHVASRSSFYFVYGTEDRLVPGIERSIAAYGDAGFTVFVERLEGAGHCNRWADQGFPTQSEQIAAKWTELAAWLEIQ